MKNCLLTLTFVAGCFASATPALAQAALPQGKDAPKDVVAVTAAGSDARPARARAPGTTSINAAASVIVLADGIVANAATAQILPPAPGFVYER